MLTFFKGNATRDDITRLYNAICRTIDTTKCDSACAYCDDRFVCTELLRLARYLKSRIEATSTSAEDTDC